METLGQVQDRNQFMEQLRIIAKAIRGVEGLDGEVSDVASALRGIDKSLEDIVRQGEEINSTLQRIARAVENMQPA